MHHLFFGCAVAKQVRVEVCEAIALNIGVDFLSIGNMWLCNKMFLVCNMVTSAVLWSIWKLRNNICIQNAVWDKSWGPPAEDCIHGKLANSVPGGEERHSEWVCRKAKKLSSQAWEDYRVKYNVNEAWVEFWKENNYANWKLNKIPEFASWALMDDEAAGA